jgi:hypothetical protein
MELLLVLLQVLLGFELDALSQNGCGPTSQICWMLMSVG